MVIDFMVIEFIANDLNANKLIYNLLGGKKDGR